MTHHRDFNRPKPPKRTCGLNVRSWHKADNPIASAFVRYWTKVDFGPRRFCLDMLQVRGFGVRRTSFVELAERVIQTSQSPSAMQPILILQLLVLLTVANGIPVIVKKLSGKLFAQSLDGGVIFLDRQPLFGSSKTIRGILFSIILTTAFAPLIGLEWKIGVVVAIMAMTGDLFSSFLKRRMKLPSSSQAIGLDQIPESLFPVLACQPMLGLTVLDIVVVVALFFIAGNLLSVLLFKWGIRDRPF
jgi:CDP-archaeol synthase